TVPLPLWLPLLVAGAICLLIARRRRPVQSGIGDGGGDLAAPTTPLELGRIENAALRLLAQADGSWVHFDDIAQAAQERRLRVQPAVERLVNLGLIEPHEDPAYGVRFGLTLSGRDLLIARGDI